MGVWALPVALIPNADFWRSIMTILSNVGKWVAILAFVSTCEGATVSSSAVYVTRNRSIATFAEYTIRVSVTYQASDLTLGTASHAIIGGPGGESASLPLGSVRNGQVTFSATFPLTSIGGAGGTWSVIINEGAQSHEDVDILVPVLNESSFASFPDFPTPSYQGNSFNVFAPMVVSGIESNASAIGKLSSTLVTNGIVYTFPAGGPFRVTSGHSISLPSVTIKTAGGQFLKLVSSTRAESVSTILVNTGPAIHPFASRCSLTAGQVDFKTSGLVPGQSYTLWRSPGLGAWEPVRTFIAPSNVHQHLESMASSEMFFRLGKNE
jgi:hypothetical protein